MSSSAHIQIYDTLTRRRQPLVPLHPGEIGMYVCGPTVYDDCHIGHLMGPTLFDAVARWLTARGYRVRFINNITDIDDKIINRSLSTGEPWQSITNRYADQYFAYLRQLHVITVSQFPRCSAYIPQMIAYIQDLLNGNRAYQTQDGVYFDVVQHPGYGKLTGRRIEEMQAGARIERNATLRSPADFALWKKAKPDEPSWPSPWGDGRPGWHIECSVMSHETLGSSFDIHGGGDDLKFPHHENEIAQGEAHGGNYAHIWMHNGLIQYDGVKVGKSDPRMKDPEFARQFKAQFLLDTFGAATVRFLLLQGHYRRPNDFAPGALTAARTALGKLHRLLGDLLEEAKTSSSVEQLLLDWHQRDLPAALREHLSKFIAEMDDDFNTGGAIAALFKIAELCRRQGAAAGKTAENDRTIQQGRELIRDLGRLIGLFQPGDAKDTRPVTKQSEGALNGVMDLVLALRQSARADRRFDLSDRIRAGVAHAGVVVSDAKDGATWELDGSQTEVLPAIMSLVLELRAQSRATKDFATSDRIRAALAQAGLVVRDAPEGATWSVADGPQTGSDAHRPA